MTFLPLILIPTLFLVVTRLKPRLPKALQAAACAVCISVATTWILLLVLRATNVSIPDELIAALVGMSLIGLTVKLEPFFERRHVKNFWLVRLTIILGGLYGIFFFLAGRWSEFVLTAIIALLLALVASFFAQGRHASHHLDNCC